LAKREAISVSGCAVAVCDLLQWSSQMHRLATNVAAASKLTTAVHLWTPCVRATDTAAIFRNGSAFILHESHDPALEAALTAMCRAARAGGGHPSWCSDWCNTLLKWSVFDLEATMVVFVDLDMEVLPRGLPHTAAAYSPDESVTNEWVALLHCARRSTWAMLSLPDHSSPVNTAFLVVKPSRALYVEGVELLERAASGHYNQTHGWDLIGPPARAVPPTDDSLRQPYVSLPAAHSIPKSG